MQLDLRWVSWRIRTVTFTPVVGDGVRENVTIAAEVGGGDGSPDFRVTFETVFGVLVPEVECAVGAGGAEGAVDGVEGDCVHGIDFCEVAGCWVLLAVAFEGEV